MGQRERERGGGGRLSPKNNKNNNKQTTKNNKQQKHSSEKCAESLWVQEEMGQAERRSLSIVARDGRD
jgi:hypothetical protein